MLSAFIRFDLRHSKPLHFLGLSPHTINTQARAYNLRNVGKRHLLVDTLGLPLSTYVTPADVQDRVGARFLLAGLKPLIPRLKKIWADGAYGGDPLAQWCHKEGGWELEVVERKPDTEGFEVIPKRWIVERTLSWIGRNRRMSKDYERKVQTSETLVEVAIIRLILRRLARDQHEPYYKTPLSPRPPKSS